MPTRSRFTRKYQRANGKTLIEIQRQGMGLSNALRAQGRTAAADRVDAIRNRYRDNILNSKNVKPLVERWGNSVNKGRSLNTISRNLNAVLDARVDRKTYMAKSTGQG